MLSEEPTLLNSNLLPVNAKGEVLFLSVVSLGNLGSEVTPISNCACFASTFVPATSALITSFSSSPRKIEMIAGGASLAPSLWSLPAVATESLSRSAYSSTALMIATRNVRNCAFSIGESPGFRRF